MHNAPIVLKTPEHRWVCSRCDHVHVTHEARPHTPFHLCTGLKGLTAPMTPHGARVNVTAHVREDYVGGEVVTRDGDGRPIMSVQVERDDGTDVAVYAPQAKVDVG